MTSEPPLEAIGHTLYLGVVGALITVPCGWLAGFAYHVALSAAERARRGEDDSS